MYFGTEAEPELVNSGQTETTFDPGGLASNTEYFWKIVAHDQSHTTDGPVWSFTTLECGVQLSDIDGNTYSTVLIGFQCRMKENLKTTKYNNGNSIPHVTDGSSWACLTTGAHVWYNNEISWKDKYGALYNWYTTTDTNGLCPSRWHAPTNDEWTALTDYIIGINSLKGNKLKSCRQINSPLGGDCAINDHPRWNADPTNYGTDDYGFSAQPGGSRYESGGFGNIGVYGSWWSSSDTTAFQHEWAWFRYLEHDDGKVREDYGHMSAGFSIRCIRD